MGLPSHNAMKFAEVRSAAEQELEFHKRGTWEQTSLRLGDRIYFITVEGEFAGTVNRDWRPPKSWPSLLVRVSLDCGPELSVELHRSLFRAFTILDHIATA